MGGKLLLLEFRSYSAISHPLDAVRNTKGPHQWSDAMMSALNWIKTEMAKHTSLVHPDNSKKYIFGTDASMWVIGAWIVQYYNKDIRFISFASISLRLSEKKYPLTNSKLLPIVFAIKKFRPYLLLKKFELRTDHRALTFLFSQKHAN